MSLNAFKALLDGGADRATRIAILASPDDDPTGIIDGSSGTICDSHYWEGEGPSGVTGQAYAALVDILDALHGRASTQSLTLPGGLKLTQVGASIGVGSPVSGHVLDLYGNTYITGLLNLTGSMNVSGALDVAGNASFSGEVTLDDGIIDVLENARSGHIGEERNMLHMDDDGNFMFRLFEAGFDGEVARNGIRFDQMALNFGIVSDLSGVDQVHFYMRETGAAYIGNGLGLDDIPANDPGLNIYLNHTSGYMFGLQTFTPDTFPVGGMTIKSRGAYNVAARTSNPLYEFSIQHQAIPLGLINQADFMVGGDVAMRLRKDSVQVAGGVLDNTIDFHVRSHLDEPDEYFVRLKPNMTALAGRKLVPSDTFSVAPAIQLGGCVGPTKTARLGFDSYDASSLLRIHLDNQSHASCIPGVAIGKPLGTYAAPVDPLVVLDNPWMVVVNDNIKDIIANYPSREGLWIGAGGGTLSHHAARVWMRDAANRRSTIHWGDVEEDWFTFVKEGVVLSIAGSSNPENVGETSALGAHLIGHTTVGDSFVDLSDIAQGLQTKYNAITGAIAIVVSTADNTAKLVARAPNGKWYSFASDGSIAT